MSHTVSAARRSGRGAAVLRALALLLVTLLWLAILGAGGMAQGQLSTVQQNDAAAFLPAEAESTRADEIAAEFTASEALPALVVVTREDGEPLTQDDLGELGRIAEALPQRAAAGIGTVGDVLVSPVPLIPSQDGDAALLPVSVDADRSDDTIGEGERVINVVVEETRALLEEELPGGLQSWVTGPGGAVADLVAAFGGIDGILLVVALVVVLVILVLVYRSPFLPFAVLLTAVAALCLAAFVVFHLADRDVLLLNGHSQGILSILVVGAATDYSLLLVARYREALTDHQSPYRAMRVAWRACLEPIAASAGTVIVGLLCLLLSDLGSNASLGPVAAIGIAASVLGALTFLPAILLVGGARARWLFWPRRPRAGQQESPADDGLWAKVARFVERRDRAVWIGTTLALVALAAFFPTLRAEGTSQSDVYLAQTESVDGEAVLAEHFDVGSVQPTTIVTSPEHLEEVLAAAEGVGGIAAVSVVRDAPGAPGGVTEGGQAGPPPGGTEGGRAGPRPAVTEGGQAGPPAEEAPIREIDGRVLVEATTADPAESTEGVQAVADVRDAVHDVDPEALVGGAGAQALDTQAVAQEDLRTIIPIVLVAIFFMLALLLRSIVAPLLLLAANVLSFASAMGLAAIFFNHVFEFPGADATVPLYGFVFLVALGIDYTIFLMTRAREESLQVGTRRGTLRALAVTGGVITSAGLVLAATFSALAVIPLLFLVQLAFIVATGVLIDTFLVRSLLVPGLVHDLGDVVWAPWSSRMRRATRQQAAATD